MFKQQSETLKNNIVEYIKSRDIVKKDELAKYFQKNERVVRRMIQEAREEGIPICMCSKGYYYPKDKSDIESTINKLLTNAQGILATAKALEATKKAEWQ